jgi:penicillin-binding protein 2
MWRKRYKEIDPEEIFIDSENLPEFDLQQFEGRLEKPISARAFPILGAVCGLIVIIFLFKFVDLQIVHGSFYKDRSENNKLKKILLIAPRGAIYSREGEPLAWNEKQNNDADFPLRKYTGLEGFSNLLGFIKYPAKDKSGFYYEEEFLPKDGAELYLNEMLAGKNGSELIETSASGNAVSQSVMEPIQNGEDAKLSIDSRVQNQFYKIIKNLVNQVDFQGGAGMIMDVDSGEMLAMVSYPQYDSAIMTEGKNADAIERYYKSSNNPFLNRTISGLYAPGSIVKPFLALAALQEKVITPEKIIVSTGQIELPNPYDASKPSIFKDWKVNGPVDMRKAIAVSSDVYFYEIGGGFGSQKGLGIDNIKKYLGSFGFSKKTGFDSVKEAEGTLPDPAWKAKNFNGEIWRIGDTYNSAIGQYGTQITPIQAVRAVASIANGGILISPSILFTSTSTAINGTKVAIDAGNFDVVREGMRMGVAEGGTAAGLNTGAVEVAGKTGTAQLGLHNQFVNSWVIGFWPYNKPKYAFTVVMEKGPVANLMGGTFVMRTLLDWMAINTPEYLK